MKKYDLITPEGTRDLLFEESIARRIAEDKLQRLFKSCGYSEVITPGLEFYDVFTSKNRYFAQENMYKLSDAKGRLMVMRPDSTTPIVRLAATRLKNEAYPLKLFYNQNIFRINPKDSGRDDEITQSGIEIIGGSVKKADAEVLTLAIEAIKSFESDDFRFEIGDGAFFKIIVSKITDNEEERERIREHIENKNMPELRRELEKYSEYEEKKPYVSALYELPRLFGGKEVFERAENAFKADESLLSVLTDIRRAYLYLSSLGFADKLAVDLGLVNKADYYTGLLFRGYIHGFGTHILSGGRYDALMGDFGFACSATGFAVNINAVAKAILKSGKAMLTTPADVLIYAEESALEKGFRYCEKLKEEGIRAENSLNETLDEAIELAQKKGIAEVAAVDKYGSVKHIKLFNGERTTIINE